MVHRPRLCQLLHVIASYVACNEMFVFWAQWTLVQHRVGNLGGRLSEASATCVALDRAVEACVN